MIKIICKYRARTRACSCSRSCLTLFAGIFRKFCQRVGTFSRGISPAVSQAGAFPVGFLSKDLHWARARARTRVRPHVDSADEILSAPRIKREREREKVEKKEQSKGREKSVKRLCHTRGDITPAVYFTLALFTSSSYPVPGFAFFAPKGRER